MKCNMKYGLKFLQLFGVYCHPVPSFNGLSRQAERRPYCRDLKDGGLRVGDASKLCHIKEQFSQLVAFDGPFDGG